MRCADLGLAEREVDGTRGVRESLVLVIGNLDAGGVGVEPEGGEGEPEEGGDQGGSEEGGAEDETGEGHAGFIVRWGVWIVVEKMVAGEESSWRGMD